ncbi:MAG TPA: hemerythrin domain-containing protein [Casimicrobiaceae bacterium]|nr:hemerythrin domain-containing protein [Casimicrobiaceae bacterium]
MNAIRIIHSEHRSLAAVLHGMLHLVREIGLRNSAPNFELFGAMVYYIDAFAERFHHPKEDEYLFKLLRLRSADATALVDRLATEHRAGAEKIRALEQALRRYEEGGKSEFAAFAEAVRAYAAFHWEHMRAEEDRLLPLARAHLTDSDWRQIDDAFAGNSDPLFNVETGAQYDALFRRIVSLAPPPIGVGPYTR